MAPLKSGYVAAHECATDELRGSPILGGPHPHVCHAAHKGDPSKLEPEDTPYSMNRANRRARGLRGPIKGGRSITSLTGYLVGLYAGRVQPQPQWVAWQEERHREAARIASGWGGR